MTGRLVVPLRAALLLDAAASGAMGLGLAALAGPLGQAFGIDRLILLVSGLAFLPWAAMVAWIARPAAPSPALGRLVAWLNVAYVGLCLFALAVGALAPTALGLVFVVGQAAAVALFAALQFAGARRAAAA